MKKVLKMYSYLIKPTKYKIITRIFLGITFSLLWNHFTNENETYMIIENVIFFVGIVLLTMAWFNYLKLDGISISMVNSGKEKKDKSKHKSKRIIDFLEEDVINEDLEQDAEIVSTIIANILTGIVFIMFSLII